MSPKKLFRRLNSKKSKAILTGFLMSLVVFSALSFNSEALAASIQDVQNKLQQVNRQIVENKKLADEAQKEASTLQGITNRLQRDINAAQAAIKDLEKQINDSAKAIASKNQAITAKQKELEIQEIHQNEIIKTIYETSDQDTVLMLAGSGSITDIINHAEYLESLESDIEFTMNAIQDITEKLKKDKEDLESKKKELAENKAQQQAYRAGLLSEKNTQDELKAEAQRQFNTYQANIASATTLRRQFESEIAEMNRRLNSGSFQARDRGVSAVGFQWPTNGLVTQPFGRPNWNAAYSFHDGMDIANSCGTPVYAASSGTVLMADFRSSSRACSSYGGGYWSGSWGNQVMIGHNARYSSRYAHLQSVTVYPGQEVKRGDIIGYMGSTGYSTGVHLHFSIFVNGVADNPRHYLP